MDFHFYENATSEILEKLIKEQEDKGEVVTEEKKEELANSIFSKESIDNLTKPIYESLIKDAPVMYENHRLEQVEFESRLQKRWLEGFYGLKSIITLSEEIGMEIVNEYLSQEDRLNEDGKYTVLIEDDVLFKLHGKAVVTSKEIMTLLQSGYPDAALSRWRTLHEISIVLSLLASKRKEDIEMGGEKGKELAKRFFSRSFIEEYKIKKLELEPDSPEMKLLEEERRLIKEEYGDKFIVNDYEWARPALKINPKKKVYFGDIENELGDKYLSVYYKQANNQIHSTAFGLYVSIGNIPNSGIGVNYGGSNYGLSLPAQLAMISICKATTSLLNIDPTLDKIIMMNALQMYMDDYSDKFYGIQTQIEEEEWEIRDNKE